MKQKLSIFDVMKFHSNTATQQHSNTATQQHSNTKIKFWGKLLFFYFFGLMFVNIGFSQNCVYQNPEFPPYGPFNPCYLEGGSIYELGFSADGMRCGIGPLWEQNFTGKVWTIDGVLGIDRNSNFTDCTFNFTQNGSIAFGKNPALPPWFSSITVTFTNCTFSGCDNNSWPGITYNVSSVDNGPNLSIINSTIKNAETGLKILTTSRFNGRLNLNNVTFDNNNIGVHFVGPFSMQEYILSDCLFKNGDIGIQVDDFPRNDNPASPRAILFDNIGRFENQNVGILCNNTEGITIRRNTFTNCVKAINIFDLKSIPPDVNLLIERNVLTNISSCGICIDGLENGSIANILENTIYGNSTFLKSFGVHVKNARGTNLRISSNNIISGFSSGIELYQNVFNILSIGRNTQISSNKIGISAYISDWFEGLTISNNTSISNNIIAGISIYGGSKGLILNNRFNILNSPAVGIDLKIPSIYDLENNTMLSNFSETASKPFIKLSNGIKTNLCCNNLSENETGLHIYGTNSLTGIRNTTFNNNNFILENSIIGDNPHAGNRFLGQTTGFLLASSPISNLFTINPSEGNAILGQMAPSEIDPVAFENVWFQPDFTGSSMSCASRCGFVRRSFNDDENQDELDIPDLGACYPAGLDRDGDGICDQNDPNPDDPCSPIMMDADGDGVCDPIDPDPNDPCTPLSLDTDGDGICDSSDPDPNDPCDPNNLDTDGDGVCDQYDGDPDVPFIPFVDPVIGNCLPPTNYNGDHRLQLGCAPGGLTIDIQNLEKLTNYPVANSPYDALNVIESKEALYKILHTTPVLRQQSETLALAYNNLCDDDIRDIMEVEYLLEDYYKQSNNTNNNIKKKELYLQRLSKLAAFLTDTIPADSIHLVRLNLSGETVFQDIKNLYNQLNNDKLTKNQILINKINSLPQNNLVYSTLKEYYQIFYNKFILDNPLSFGDTISLSLIADLCPLEYGKVVYKAREVLLGEGFREEGDFEDYCMSVEFRNKKTNSKHEPLDCMIYPNPAQDKVFISSGFEMSGMQIFNSLGISVFENNQLIGQTYELSLDSFQDGVYYFSIYGINGEKIFKKVVFIQ